jgi:hypothetical protein
MCSRCFPSQRTNHRMECNTLVSIYTMTMYVLLSLNPVTSRNSFFVPTRREGRCPRYMQRIGGGLVPPAELRQKRTCGARASRPGIRCFATWWTCMRSPFHPPASRHTSRSPRGLRSIRSFIERETRQNITEREENKTKGGGAERVRPV